MNISDITKAVSPAREFECELVDGFFVTVQHISKKEMLAMQHKSEVMRYDAGTKTRRVDSDSEKFNQLFSNAAVKGWRGLTVGGLALLIPVDRGELKPTEPVEYTRENATTLIANSTDFDAWITGICFDTKLFSDFDVEVVEKNSKSSSKKKDAAFEER